MEGRWLKAKLTNTWKTFKLLRSRIRLHLLFERVDWKGEFCFYLPDRESKTFLFGLVEFSFSWHLSISTNYLLTKKLVNFLLQLSSLFLLLFPTGGVCCYLNSTWDGHLDFPTISKGGPALTLFTHHSFTSPYWQHLEFPKHNISAA